MGAGPIEVGDRRRGDRPRAGPRALHRDRRAGRRPGGGASARRAAGRDPRRASPRGRRSPSSRTPSPAPAGPSTASGVTATRPATAGRCPASRSRCPAAPAPTCSWSPRRVDGGTGLFLVQGDADGPDPHGLPHPRRHACRPGRARRHARRARSATAPPTDRRDRAGAGRGPDRLRPRGHRRDGHGAADDRGVPHHPQAVRGDAQQVPGAHLPGRGHVRLARAGPQHRAVGHDGDRGRRRRRRRPPTGPGCRSAGPAGTSARRPSSCTAASA